MGGNIYKSSDTVRGHDPSTEVEDTNTMGILKTQRAESLSAGSRCYRLAAVGLGLLCVLLLTGITVLWIRFNHLTAERDQLQAERERLPKKCSELDNAVRNGWIYFSFSLYYMSTEKKNWTESRDECSKNGSDLVIINSREEQVFINKLKKGPQVWIGLSDVETEGVWKWVDGSELITGFWRPGEPNSNGDEDCVTTDIGSDPLNNWNDYPCNRQLVWICEKRIKRVDIV